MSSLSKKYSKVERVSISISPQSVSSKRFPRVGFLLLAVHLVSNQVYVMKKASQKSRFPACRGALDQEVLSRLIIRQTGEATFRIPHSKPVTPWPGPSCARCLTWTSVGDGNHTGNGVNWHERGVTQPGGKEKKVNFSTNATSQRGRD